MSIGRSAVSTAQRRSQLEQSLLRHMEVAAAERESEVILMEGSRSTLNPINFIKQVPVHYAFHGGGKGVAKLGAQFVGKAIIARLKQQICRWVCY